MGRWDRLPAGLRRLAVAAALGLVWLLAAVVLPQGAPPGRVLTGAILGAATALTAMGLVLVWRSNRVINFAAGGMGAALGVAAIRTYLIWGWPYWAAVLAGVAAGALTGVLVEVLVVRRFARASRLVLTVATLGLSQLLGGVELFVPGWIFGDRNVVTLGGYRTPLDRWSFSVGTDVINGNHLLILAVVPLVMGALGWFLTGSRAGIAVRGAAENAERARLLGVPVRRLQSLVWAIAGALAALTLVLRAPFSGTPPTAALGPAVLLGALAAAVIARMESLTVAAVAALVLGAVDQVVRWNTRTPSLADVVLLGIILGALLLQRSQRSRAFDADGGWQHGESDPPLPAAIAALRSVRIIRAVTVLAGLAVLVLVPLWLSPSQLNTLSLAAVWAIVAISLCVLTGWNGQISLGQFAVVGVGAIVAGNLMSRWNVDLFVAMAAAAAAGGVVALLLGLPALRIRGPFLAVVTLAFAVVLDGYVLNPNVFPDLIPQNVRRPVLWQRWSMVNDRTMFWFVAAVLVAVMVAMRGVRRARSGRVFLAGRDNRKAAEAMSVPTSRWVLTGFVLSGVLAGLAGSLHVVLLTGARVGSYQPVQSVEVFAMSTIGGLGSLGGSASGAALLRGGSDLITSTEARLVLLGTGLLVVLWVVPGGLASIAASWRRRLFSALARRRGLDPLGRPLGGPLPSVGVAVPDAVTGTPDAGHLLACSGVDVSYGQLQVLFGAHLQVAAGEIVALLGTNGAGKSTLLRALAGLTPATGSFRFDGADIGGTSPEALVRRGVALMPGGRSIFPTLSVDEHLRLATWTFARDHQRIRSDIDAVMALFPALSRHRQTLAGNLSGGEQQQLALAQTLMLRPRVLLIDELSLGLAPTVVAQLLDVVRQLNRAGVTVVVVEQSVNVALTLAERAVFMEKGQVRFEGPTAELLDRPDILRAVFLEGAGAASQDETADGEVAALDLTRFGTLARAVPAVASGQVGMAPVLRAAGLSKRFGGVVAVDGVDLEVRPGEIVGLVGQNGAGKTTLVDCISGFHSIDGGRLEFRGHDVTDWAPHERARGRLGRSFQEARLFPSLTVAQTIAVACERHAASRSLVADAFRQPASYESELAIAATVDELVDLLGLVEQRDKLAGEISTGTRRIVELACLLAEEPVVLLLDEPSAGVAQRETEALGPLLRRIRDATGVAMVVIEHDMPLLSSICDRLVALELGRVIAEGTPAEVLADQRVIDSYLGRDAAAINRSGAVSA